MKSHISLYPSPRTEVSAHWMSPKPPGWVDEGGWIAFREAFAAPEWDMTGGIIIYLDREQALRLRRVLGELVDKMPDQAGAEGVTVDVQ